MFAVSRGDARRASRPVRWTVMRARAAPLRSFDPSDITIEGLTPLSEICDAFVCKSSPAVEGSLRQIATDLVALREDKRSLFPFANDVTFDDGARKFVGREGFTTHVYVADYVTDAKAGVERMQMLELDRATIVWRLQGANRGGKVDIRVTADLTLNLITGRATSVVETWDVSGCDAGAATFIKITRAAVATPRNIADAAGRLRDGLLKAIGGGGDGDAAAGGRDIQADPNDPMKFFQNANTPQDDYLQLALFVSAIYLVVRLVQAGVSLG